MPPSLAFTAARRAAARRYVRRVRRLDDQRPGEPILKAAPTGVEQDPDEAGK